MKTVPLSQIVQINPRSPKGLEDSREISFVPMASVSENGGIIRQETRNFGEVKKGFTYFQRGDVLLAKITPCFENGKSALADNLEHPIGFGSTEFHVLRAIPGKVDSRFLYHLVRSNQLLFLGQKAMKGAAGHKRVPAEFLEDFEVPEWPLDDQIRIAHLLGKVEGLIALRKQNLQQLDDLLKSVFLEMFGDPVRNEKGWAPTTIGEIIKVASGKGLVAKNMDTEGPHKVYGGNGVNGTHTEYMFDTSTLVIGRVGYYCGSVHITEPKSWVTDNALYVKEILKATDLIFLKYLLDAHDLNKVAGRAAQPLVSGSRIYPIHTIDVPFKNQREFSAVAEKVAALKSRYQQTLTDLDALYGALSQQALKGELDLSQVAWPAAPIEGESFVAAALPTPLATPVINLPETELLLPVLDNREQLKPLLRFWLESYRAHLGSAVFSVEHFIAAAQTRLAELHPDNDFELGADAYEHIKSWLFEALTAGHLKQLRNITGHEEETGKPILGNMLELRVAQA
ncbi:restriction endonuclease subunit S [Pseudomonas extremorientalis]|jgi:type I restriction enzyme S subunit|uniref:restriction endonuclease subunit S n=1 Tax=Pseudomonas TaxID=286 RepID=UPI000F55DF0D|nr:restriction endonuclease subunit S [Pseudomonas chlororaphis]AZC73734.1 Type I restriction-modification system, specificity subunit S [Pseudomonas chlororaphis subsp. piscium]